MHIETKVNTTFIMGEKIKKLKKIKKIRIHREGTNTLMGSLLLIAAVAAVLWFCFDTKIPFWAFLVVFGPVWFVVLNFYRCPIRYFNGEYGGGSCRRPCGGD